MLVYMKDFSAGWDFLNSHIWLGSFVRRVPLALLPFLSGAAAVTWHLRFGVVDAQLWLNWKQRIEDINKAATGGETAKKSGAKSAS